MGTSRDDTHSDLPGRRLGRLAGLVLLVGLAGAVAWVAYALSDQTHAVNDFTRLPPRSGMPVAVEERGLHTVWASAACGGLCDVPPLAELHELVTLGFDGPSGMVRPGPFPGESSYYVGGDRRGTAAWVVEFPEAGTYELERENRGVGAVVLQLGEGKGMPSRIVPGAAAIAAGATALSAALFALGRYRRHRAVVEMVERVRGGV